MGKEKISDIQGINLITFYITGTTLVLVPGLIAKEDTWMAIILSMVMAFFIVLVYGRILYLFPGSDLMDILENIFGKIIGKIMGLIYTWFAFHLGALVLRNFGEFINTVALPETPQVVPIIGVTILSVWATKKGIEVLGRWVELFYKIVFVSIFITILLLIPNMDIKNVQPLLYNGFKPVLMGAHAAFAFPFAETVVFLMILSCLQEKRSGYRVYIGGIFVGGIIVLSTTLTDLLVLGPIAAGRMYFPAYTAVSRVNVGDFIQRIEIVVAMSFLVGGFIKVSICLLATSKGVSKILGCDDYRFILIPVALMMVNLSQFIYPNIMEMIHWAMEIWPYYAFPFQVIFPIIIWIAAELKVTKKQPRKGTG